MFLKSFVRMRNFMWHTGWFHAAYQPVSCGMLGGNHVAYIGFVYSGHVCMDIVDIISIFEYSHLI